MDFSTLSALVKEYYEFRSLKTPNAKDAAIWALSEGAEILDAVMRLDPEWVRNNPDKKVDVGSELGDCLMMLVVYAQQSGKTFSLDFSQGNEVYDYEPLKDKAAQLIICLGFLIKHQEHYLTTALYALDDVALSLETYIDPVNALLQKMASKGFSKALEYVQC